MLVRFASDRRNDQGGAKRNRRMQELPKIELVLRYCLHLPMKMGKLIRSEVQERSSVENGMVPYRSVLDTNESNVILEISKHIIYNNKYKKIKGG